MKNEIIKEYRVAKKDSTYTNRTRPMVEFKCFKCGTIQSVRKDKYKENIPCKTCRQHEVAEKRFFLKAQEKFGDKFDLSQVKYIDCHTKVLVTCKKHNNSYYILPQDFIRLDSSKDRPNKGGCIYCARESQKAAIRNSFEHYKLILKERFPMFEIVKHGEALTNTESIVLKCPYHGIFKTRLAYISRLKHLCPKCSDEWLQWRTKVANIEQQGHVYFAYIPELNVYKLGATSQEVKKRCSQFNKKVEIQWSLDFNTLVDALFVELYLFRTYWSHRCRREEFTNGKTELLDCYIEKPSLRFIEEILCLKELNSEEILPDHAEDNTEPSMNNTHEGATTISKESTSQVNGDGNSSPLSTLCKEVDIV